MLSDKPENCKTENTNARTCNHHAISRAACGCELGSVCVDHGEGLAIVARGLVDGDLHRIFEQIVAVAGLDFVDPVIGAAVINAVRSTCSKTMRHSLQPPRPYSTPLRWRSPCKSAFFPCNPACLSFCSTLRQDRYHPKDDVFAFISVVPVKFFS